MVIIRSKTLIGSDDLTVDRLDWPGALLSATVVDSLVVDNSLGRRQPMCRVGTVCATLGLGADKLRAKKRRGDSDLERKGTSRRTNY